MERPVVLCGLGRVGWRVFDSLRATGASVVVIDSHTSADDPRLHGSRLVRGDCRRQEVLEEAGVRDARGVVVVTSEDLVNVSTALLVRRLNPTVRVVVRMFNQALIARLGGAVKNMVALSVSALTAPLLALTAVTGETLGAFRLPAGPRQVCEFVVADGTDAAGKRVVDFCEAARLLPFALVPAGGDPKLLIDVPADHVLAPGDRLIVCGAPSDLRPVLDRARGDLLPALRWAGAVRRWVRTLGRTVGEIDFPVKAGTAALFLTLLASTLAFRYGIGTSWADGLYQTVTVVATGSELPGTGQPAWAKVFLSVLKLAGAALIAGFTAILTNYLLRARLGGALELRRVPDGGHVVVCGLGNVGYRCVEELTAMGERVVAIDKTNDNPFLATVRRKGVAAFVGDATVVEVLRQARADTAKAVIAAADSELANLEIALLVRELNPSQRVIVRLTDPEFAGALRDAADIRHAVSVPALAAPAFAAALFGDRVQTLITVAGRTLVVIDVTVQDDDPCLADRSLRAAARDYRFLPVGDTAARGQRLKAGDKLTVVAEMPDLERLLRREAVPRGWGVTVERFPRTACDVLFPLVRASRHCGQEEAERVVAGPPFELATGLTRGEAEELLTQVTRERVTARVVSSVV